MSSPTRNHSCWIIWAVLIQNSIYLCSAFSILSSTPGSSRRVSQHNKVQLRNNNHDHSKRSLLPSVYIYNQNQEGMAGGERDDYGRKRKDNDFLMTEQVRIDDLLNGKVANGDLPSTSEVANKCFISRALTPNYILYPHFFASASSDAEDDKEEEDNRALSFPFALQKMIQSLKSLLEENTLCNDQLLRLKLGIMDHEEFPSSEKASSSSSSSGTSPRRYTIQIQQKISHTVDALCWIHANQPKIDACTNTVYTGISGLGATTYTATSSSSQPCMIYMCNAENTFEGAAIGEAWRVDDLSKDDCWDMIRSLPCGSGLYGGRRFDTEGDVGEDWEEFGKELWVLPLVELRLEKKYKNRGMSTMGVDCDVVESIQEMEVKRDIEDMKLMVHLHFSSKESLIREVKRVLELLDMVTPDVSASVPCATLPPILSRGYNPDAQDIFEGGVNAALECFQRSSLASLDDGTAMKKVVLARRADLYFGTQLKGLDVLKTLKFGGSVGHLFYMNPGRGVGKDFFGCTPERLFQVKGDEKMVISEALAGTRPRGSTSEDDAELLRELIHSKKDKEENIITGDYIQNIFDVLVQQNMLEMNASVNGGEDSQGKFFVRRLRQLQHICQSFEGRIKNESRVVDIIRYLMEMLHPTPAVCGYPRKHSIEFIRRYEGRSFDRGLYSGPFGYLGSNTADIIVAIRSALITRNIDYSSEVENFLQSKVSVYAGAGIVQGSTAQGEWSETGYKLGVLSSLFAQSPLTLKSFQTPNEAWATAFVEELIRSGVTQFYICPGSRSTPLTTALARAQRTHVGIIDCISTHDERGAAFRALGYARGARRPAAVVTSSGTAVANLYPAVVEAGMDGIPILLLTADRPYENRDTGANQAIDQIKVFSETYVRWFRDISPPSEDVPITLALSDANHAVRVAKELLGPVHLNIQFRENLAPEAGPIRGDNRVGSVTSFSADRFTDVAGFQRWSGKGLKWAEAYYSTGSSLGSAVYDIGSLIARSKRGIIVIGNIRNDDMSSDAHSTAAIISDFAETIGFPLFVGAQSAHLRFLSAAVVPYADHILKNKSIKDALRPDLIIQIGTHIISNEVQGLISQTMKSSSGVAHVLLHTERPAERVDSTGTITHQIDSSVETFIPRLTSFLQRTSGFSTCIQGSDLYSLILLGRRLSERMPDIIHDSSQSVAAQTTRVWEKHRESLTYNLTEPQILLAMSEVLSEMTGNPFNLFLSNSMPVRDAEFFLYPRHELPSTNIRPNLSTVAVNRGASGIDGIISSAMGFCEALSTPTTLLIGDLACIHDLNSFHNLAKQSSRYNYSSRKPLSLSTIIVNNDGGAIFSFLPIAKHGSDVNFEEFFGTPTRSFSFGKGAEAFGLAYSTASDYRSFKKMYKDIISSDDPYVLEAKVVNRDQNVQVHTEITRATNDFLDNFGLFQEFNDVVLYQKINLPTKFYKRGNCHDSMKRTKSLILLHGWMGDKTEWDQSAQILIQSLPDEWNVISIDLPGHGDSPLLFSEKDLMRGFINSESDHISSLEDVAMAVLRSIQDINEIEEVDAIAGYSLGGRVAMAMMKIAISTESQILSNDTKIILLGSDPGSLDYDSTLKLKGDANKLSGDKKLSHKLDTIYLWQTLMDHDYGRFTTVWSEFLSYWYGKPLWGNLKERNPLAFSQMVQRRTAALSHRALDISRMLNICSTGRNLYPYSSILNPKETVFVAGELDKKYATFGQEWKRKSGVAYYEIKGAGHALLTEEPVGVANIISQVLTKHGQDLLTPVLSPVSVKPKGKDIKLPSMPSATYVTPSTLDFEEFEIELIDSRTGSGVKGIGWGDQRKLDNIFNLRKGLIISLSSNDGFFVGLGEVSPLSGVHSESFDEAKKQTKELQRVFGSQTFTSRGLQCERVLSVDGSMTQYIDDMISDMNEQKLLSFRVLGESVRSGLEMAILSLASHKIRSPLPQSLLPSSKTRSDIAPFLPLNGLITPKESTFYPVITETKPDPNDISYSSIKVKVGHISVDEDAIALINAKSNSKESVRIRADANRAWRESDAFKFSQVLKTKDVNIVGRLEFIEEPLQKILNAKGLWSFKDQVEALERWHNSTGIKYALDESLADAVRFLADKGNAGLMIKETMQYAKGCAAFVLKPSLLGFDLSMELARLAHNDLRIGVVFTSTFDSGVGLAFTAFAASLSDSLSRQGDPKFPHGLSTFSMMGGDTLTPPFGSFVNKDGLLNVASLGRSMNGLGLDEIRDYIYAKSDSQNFREAGTYDRDDKFQSTSSTSDTGREINIHVSLPLPFSDEVACARFTDLPQQPRWSPWLNSVAYLEKGLTEWTLNVRGVEFRWKAISKLLESPKGIMWESTSGLKNQGRVEFIKVSDDSCLMTVKMSIVAPRIISLVFKTTGEFVKDFVESKLLKWSLESFRDVVKADLALERGDAELGDALFGAVEGRSNAIEATLSYQERFEETT